MFYVRVVSGSVVFGAGTSEIEERLKSFELKTGNFVKLWSSRNDTFLHRCGHDTRPRPRGEAHLTLIFTQSFQVKQFIHGLHFYLPVIFHVGYNREACRHGFIGHKRSSIFLLFAAGYLGLGVLELLLDVTPARWCTNIPTTPSNAGRYVAMNAADASDGRGMWVVYEVYFILLPNDS